MCSTTKVPAAAQAQAASLPEARARAPTHKGLTVREIHFPIAIPPDPGPARGAAAPSRAPSTATADRGPTAHRGSRGARGFHVPASNPPAFFAPLQRIESYTLPIEK